LARNLLTAERLAQLDGEAATRGRYWRGRADLGSGDWGGAAEWITAAIPDMSDAKLQQAAYYDVGIAYWQAEQRQRAIQWLEDAIEKWPRGEWAAETLFLLSQAAWESKQWEDLERWSNDFESEFGQHALLPRIRELQGRMALSIGDYVSAERTLESLLANAESIDLNDEHLRLERAFQLYLLGLARLGQGQLESALASLNDSRSLLMPFRASLKSTTTAISREPSDRSQVDSSNLEFFELPVTGVSESTLTTNHNQHETNLSSLRRLIEQVYYARANLLIRLKRWSEAVSAQDELLSINPESSYRNELQSDRLRALAATNEWQMWQSTAIESIEQLGLSIVEDAAQNDEGSSIYLSADDTKKRLFRVLTATAGQHAELCYRQKNFAESVRWYRVASRSPVRDVAEWALAGLAWSQFQTEQPETQAETAQLLMERFPDSPFSGEVGLELAQQAFKDGRIEAAHTMIDQLLTRLPDWPLRHHLLALKSRIVSLPGTVDAKLQSVEWLLRAIEVAESNRLIMNGSQSDDLVSTLANDSVTSRGETPEIRRQAIGKYRYELAWLFQETGDRERAIDEFEKINVGLVDSEYWADATFRVAQSHFVQQRYSIAVDLLQQIFSAANTISGDRFPELSGQPETDGLRAITVSSRTSLGNRPETSSESESIRPELDSTEEQTGLTPLVAPDVLCHAYHLRIMIGAAEKDWNSVAAWGRRLTDQFPDHQLRWPTQYWWGEAEFRNKNYDRAIELLTEIIPRTDDREESWVAMTHLRLAQSYGHANRWRDVLTIAEPARERFPDFLQSYELDYLIGRSLATDGNFPQARAAYQKVVDSKVGGQTETAAMAQWMIGETYLHQEQFALAAEAYHRTESLYPYPQWQAAALLQAGKCYESLRRDIDAIRVYRQLLEEYPNCSLAEAAKSRLDVLVQRQDRTARR
jgi:tetratricopeptide (TPR) repeat protein